jgi:HK97 family phage portal protein
MSFWTWLTGESSGVTPNDNGPSDYNPGDPDGADLSAFTNMPESRGALPTPSPSPWSGWPSSWGLSWQQQANFNKLIDVAWACVDLNSSVISSMPAYRLRNGEVIAATKWMTNPDPTIYCSWNEFVKQLMWDYMLGEAFVLPMATQSDGYPGRFRVIPPWLINVEMRGGSREYRIGGEHGQDVTDEILHIRYQSTSIDAHGHGPLEVAGARMTQIGLLQRYTNNLAETGGIPFYWLELDKRLTQQEGRDLLNRWIETRAEYAGYPALVTGGAKLNQARSFSAGDMALMEMQQFNEARIAILLGVPPFLVGLPGATGSLTYSNIESLFSYHDRSSLRPKVHTAMAALSQWALPTGQSIELNRDDYTRPGLADRANAYKTLVDAGILNPVEARVMERLLGGGLSAAQLSGVHGVSTVAEDDEVPERPPTTSSSSPSGQTSRNVPPPR